MVLDTGNTLCTHHHQPSHNSFHLVNWELSPQNINLLSSPLPAPGIQHSTSCLYNVDYSKCLVIFLSSNNIAFVQSRSIQLFVTPWTAARQASLSFTISWNLLKLMSIESVMPSNHLTLCLPLLLWECSQRASGDSTGELVWVLGIFKGSQPGEPGSSFLNLWRAHRVPFPSLYILMQLVALFQPMGLQRVGHNWATNTNTFFFKMYLFLSGG